MKKDPVLFAVSLSVLCIALTLAGCIGIFLSRFGGSEGLRDALRFAEAREIILSRFVGDVDGETLTDGALYGMTEATGDRWSYYMTAEEYAAYLDYGANEYTGVGITVAEDESGRGLEIVGVTADSPAEAAGIRAGMLLTAVNGESMAGKTASQARAAIQAAAEGDIALSLLTESGETLDVTVRAERLHTQVVTSELRDDGIGYVRIANFEDGAADGAIEAVDALLEAGAAGIVFDVRGNPGGKLSELIELLDYLLPEGDLFVSRTKDGQESVETSGPECVELPMAVLINADSYSAAEFFAAALWEYDWAVTVGEATTGKARSQISVVMSDGGAVHLSTASYLTPNRVDLAETGGLVPDIPVALTETGDAQLDAAVEYLLGK